MREETFEFNGHKAEIIIPDNPNGKWIWKTEFFKAFDQAEVALCKKGYTRVYYGISDKYGSDKAIRLMRAFYHEVIKRYNLDEKAILFGFSRGALYAFNFALFYPEYTSKVYLDAPVMDMKSWPMGTACQGQMLAEYWQTEENFPNFKGNPIDNLEEFFSLNIPLLIIAGTADMSVAFEKNAGAVIEYCKEQNIEIMYVIKENVGHHPHSLEDTTIIEEFCENE